MKKPVNKGRSFADLVHRAGSPSGSVLVVPCSEQVPMSQALVVAEAYGKPGKLMGLTHKCGYVVRAKSGDYYKPPYVENCGEPVVVFYGIIGIDHKIVKCKPYCLDHEINDHSEDLVDISREEYEAWELINN